MRMRNHLLAGALSVLALTAAPALADGPLGERAAAEEQAAFAADRADILSMAGNYSVLFDMQESTPWMAGYEPIDHDTSAAFESVRVIEDTGRKIVLQHLLVVKHDGENHVIKHWRQDWQYEPEKILAYQGEGRWKWEEVPERMRTGRWSQTVYQVDDSPRYAGWGAWDTVGGVRRWRSSWTWRPLARRDAVRHPIYDRYLAINRHQNTPDGWIHWQDNMKMGMIDGELKPVVQEYVLNTYSEYDGYDVAAADAYWAATKGYWAAVRAKWDAVAEAKGGIAITENPETGTVISAQLLSTADAVQKGQISEQAAIDSALGLIDEFTGDL